MVYLTRTFTITAATLPEVLARLTANDVAPLLACTQDGVDPRTVSAPARWALVLGAEADGLPPGLAGQRLTLPLDPRSESLNVAMAGTVLLWELTRGGARGTDGSIRTDPPTQDSMS